MPPQAGGAGAMFSQESERGALLTGRRQHCWAEGAPGSEATRTTACEAGGLNKTFGCELGTEMPVVKETGWTRRDLTLAIRVVASPGVMGLITETQVTRGETEK